MTILKQNKVLRNLGGEVLTSHPTIIDIDIDYNYKLNGSNIQSMKNRASLSQTIYQPNTARQPIYNGTENAGECDTANRELYLPNSKRLEQYDLTPKPISFYLKGKLKDIIGDKYVMENAVGATLLSLLLFTDNTLRSGKTPFPVILTGNQTTLVDNYFEILIVNNGYDTVTFLNGVFHAKTLSNEACLFDLSERNVIFGNTRLSNLKYNGYFKAFKIWDYALVNVDNY